MRSPLWFVVAGIVALAGIAGAVLHLLPRIAGLEARMIQVVMPGSATLRLAEPGSYTIYHEAKSVVDGRYYASTSADGLSLRLESAAGRRIALNKPGSTSSYSLSSRSGTSIFDFTIDTAGDYRLTGTLPGGRTEPRIVLAVGQGFVGEIFAMVGTTLAILFAALGIAGAIVAVVLINRRKTGKAATTGGVPLGHGGPNS
jgi:hypothetical protein